MSILNLIFGTSKKVYRSTIEKIPGAVFSREVKIKIGENEKRLVGEDLRDELARMAGGGISLTSLEEKLKKIGLKDNQYEQRKDIMRIIKNNLN